MEELVQYIVVNKDLGMSSGKIAAQVGHVCTICSEYYLSFGRDDGWCKPNAIEPDTTKYHLPFPSCTYLSKYILNNC